MMRIKALALLVTALACLPARAAPPVVGAPAPSFRATLPDGGEVALDDLRGDVVVINFWATWCVPCKAELPRLDTFYRANQAAGLRVIAVTTDDAAPALQLKPLAKQLAIPLVRHFRGDYAPIRGAVPTNFVIDRRGIVRYAKAGAFTLDELNRLLIPLLQEAEPAAPTPAVAGGRPYPTSAPTAGA